jgi:hypothetical protein
MLCDSECDSGPPYKVVVRMFCWHDKGTYCYHLLCTCPHVNHWNVAVGCCRGFASCCRRCWAQAALLPTQPQHSRSAPQLVTHRELRQKMQDPQQLAPLHQQQLLGCQRSSGCTKASCSQCWIGYCMPPWQSPLLQPQQQQQQQGQGRRPRISQHRGARGSASSRLRRWRVVAGRGRPRRWRRRHMYVCRCC